MVVPAARPMPATELRVGEMTPQRRLRVGMLVVLAAIMVVLEQAIIRISGFAPGVPTARGPTLLLLLAWAGLAALGTAAALRLPPRWALLIVFAGLLAVQFGGITRSVVISSDLYRYAWDGQVQS